MCPRRFIAQRWSQRKSHIHRDFFPHVLPCCHQLRSLLDQSVRPPRTLIRDVPGHGKHLAILLQGTAGVMRVPLYSAASTTKTPIEIPLMMRLRMGKFCGAANVFKGNSETTAPPVDKNLIHEPAVLFGINNIHSGPKDCHRLALGRDRSSVASGICRTESGAESRPQRCPVPAGNSHCPEDRAPRADRGFASADKDMPSHRARSRLRRLLVPAKVLPVPSKLMPATEGCAPRYGDNCLWHDHLRLFVRHL